MSFNTFGHVLRVTTWGESHGPAIGAVVDGCPPGLALVMVHEGSQITRMNLYLAPRLPDEPDLG